MWVRFDEVRRDPDRIVTIGTFDGVHRGHDAILQTLTSDAAERSAQATVVTFDPHPREVLANATKFELLTTIDERAELLRRRGVDDVAVIGFTKEFSETSWERFFEEWIIARLGCAELIVGFNHAFGHNRQGTVGNLMPLAARYGVEIKTVGAMEVEHESVSSTKIRTALQEGDVERAKAFLGRPYSLRGTVTRGDGRGRTLGFATANIVPDHPRKLVPAHGVYATTAKVENGMFHAMLNIGTRPTFTRETNTVIEAHLLDFHGDLYEKKIEIGFLQRLRAEQKFSSIEELKAQLEADRDQTKKIFTS